MHDDLVHRQFAAARTNQLWLTDITEHPPKASSISARSDTCSNRIVGYSMNARMTSQLVVPMHVLVSLLRLQPSLVAGLPWGWMRRFS